MTKYFVRLVMAAAVMTLVASAALAADNNTTSTQQPATSHSAKCVGMPPMEAAHIAVLGGTLRGFGIKSLTIAEIYAKNCGGQLLRTAKGNKGSKPSAQQVPRRPEPTAVPSNDAQVASNNTPAPAPVAEATPAPTAPTEEVPAKTIQGGGQ